MSHSNAYDDREAGRLPRNQPGSDSAPGFAPRTDPASSSAYEKQGIGSRKVVWALDQLLRDRSITAAGRELVRMALTDARAIHEAEQCAGCNPRGQNVRQQPDGSLMCLDCGREVSPAEEEARRDA